MNTPSDTLENTSVPTGPKVQTTREEIANAVTHGIGAILSLACLTLGVVFAAIDHNPWNVVAVSIYGVTMFLLYLFSYQIN